jgi:hypothetical protein
VIANPAFRNTETRGYLAGVQKLLLGSFMGREFDCIRRTGRHRVSQMRRWRFLIEVMGRSDLGAKGWLPMTERLSVTWNIMHYIVMF